MAAKKRKLSLLAAAITFVAAPAVFASIPRSTIFDASPSIDLRHESRVDGLDVDAAIDNARLLHRALDRSFPAPAPVDSLSKSRVWVSRLSAPLFHRASSPLSRSLRRASAVAWRGIASDRTVLTPDPLGYGASGSNLYNFCAGDPVNRRDPTGEDSYDDKYSAYLAWYSSHMDALWQKRRSLAEQIRKQRAVTSDTGLLESEDNLLAVQMMTFGGAPDNAALLIDYARAHGRTDVLSMSFEQLHGAVLADEGVKNMGTAVVAAFGPHIAQTEGINFGGALKRVKQFASDAIDAYNESVFSSEVGAVGPGVVNAPKASDPFRVVPSRYRANVRRAFAGVAGAEVTTDELVVYRRWGGKSGPTGSPWYSTNEYARAGNARRYQALPSGNTAENASVYVVRKGATILRGKTASQVGVSGFGPYATGAGEQIYVVNPADVRKIR